MANAEQHQKIAAGQGFIAALDQSGGSTPKALKLYGVNEDQYSSEAEMYDLIHAMRSRIAQSPAFTGDKVIGAILFEMTMDRDIGGKPAAQYLWEERGIVPFLKIDKGLEPEADGVQLLKPIPGLGETLDRARALGIFGTKERSVINAANAVGIAANVAQQFELAAEVIAHDLMPIIEPEVNINAHDKDEAEELLLTEIRHHLNTLPSGKQVMLKLTLPTKPNLYKPLVDHPGVLKVVALSGGYSRAEACEQLALNTGVVASFSRALTEGLSAQQTDEEFDALLAKAIDGIHKASISG
ncbi:fructose bisphosphate aldolase [Vannielia sp.]|uniref:fructose bisphosphate aldolase n=1 Tax=Vannielia sp. TaxID=2813045 RepID=UPI0026064FFB|nr:fructose bisphosphate aldolase [Vannielia sp.]MDF1873016.1 fructose bisphosphate aldolase [Vannielia sp.]